MRNNVVLGEKRRDGYIVLGFSKETNLGFNIEEGSMGGL